MVKDYILPSPVLQEYIDRYWFWECDKNEKAPLPDIFPATGAEMIFHYRDPFKSFPQSHIVCPRSNRNYILKQSGEIGFISVRFKCWALPYFSNIPTERLRDEVLQANTLWPGIGKDLESRLFEAADNVDRTNILNHFFEKFISLNEKRSPEVDWAINYIYYNHSNVSISDLINDCSLSSRTFQRKFKLAAGVSAKSFQKIARFEKTYKSSLLSGRYPSLENLLSRGYYDQPHFNKDFRLFTGKNPTEIISTNNNLAHFYNTSITK